MWDISGDVKANHDKTMDLAERALVAKIYKRDPLEKMRLFREALVYERAAIDALTDRIQPTWSVLCRSAGTLALDCREFDLAVELANMGLTDDCDGLIAWQIENLLADIRAARHDWAYKRRKRDRVRFPGGVYGRRVGARRR